MSQPISGCFILKAAVGDKDAYDWLIKAYTTNLKYGHWTTFGCSHNPPCAIPTEAQKDDLQARITEHFKNNPVKQEDYHRGISGYRGYYLPKRHIRQRAYEIWQETGGNEKDNWIIAEKELRQKGMDGTLEQLPYEPEKDRLEL